MKRKKEKESDRREKEEVCVCVCVQLCMRVCGFVMICYFVLCYFYVVVFNEQNNSDACATKILAIVSPWLQRNSLITKKYQVPLGFVRKVFNCIYKGNPSFVIIQTNIYRSKSSIVTCLLYQYVCHVSWLFTF